jgi:hypothetical protein
MVELTRVELSAARAAAQLRRATEPHATSARYDRKSGRIVVELDSGATFTFPPQLVEGLTGATADELADIELLGEGYGLHWERLDVDYTVPGLLNGVFGTDRWMAARAGRTTSPAKAAAARANGAKGGRPRKAG